MVKIAVFVIVAFDWGDTLALRRVLICGERIRPRTMKILQMSAVIRGAEGGRRIAGIGVGVFWSSGACRAAER